MEEDMEMDQELLAEFLVESNENLGDIEQQLLDMEDHPDDEDAINCIFRAIHTVKGTCGFLGLSRLEALSHAAENLLGKIRSEKFSMTSDLVSLLLDAVDGIKSIIAGIEETGAEPDTDYSKLSNRLQAATRAVTEMAASGVQAEGTLELEEEEVQEEASPETEVAQEEAPAPVEEVAAKVEEAPAAPKKAAASKKPAKKKPAPKKEAAPKPAAETTIRVDVDVVDDLMNQVGELVLTRNRFMQMITDGNLSPDVQRMGHYIDHTTTTLQDQVLRLRMQPVAGLWNRVPRVVRDLSRDLKKKIRVEMSGQDTELDRFILAALRDPMTHIIRNSCDHGVEVPAVRVKAGKTEEGLIRLSAKQESGNILIEVTDDGGGIPAEVIRAKAIKMGVLDAEVAEKMSDNAIIQLIFHPGLSTAETVSKVSGRGVGMDVVRSEIEKTGGYVEVESTMGKGTTLRMRIPLTLAIIPALIVDTNGQQFAVPQMNVQELISVNRNDDAWEDYAGSHFYRLRDTLLPVIQLTGLLGLPEKDDDEFAVVVVNVGKMSFGLAMDSILGAEEIVVKPLGAHFQNIALYAGCSILGDGGVVPILDCNGVMAAAHMSDGAQDVADDAAQTSQGRIKRNLQHVVLFQYDGGRYAIPMSLVQRLETIESSSVEISAGREVLQYRQEVIPFRRWSNIVGGGGMMDESSHEMACIILSNGESHICLEVERIIDVAEVPIEIELGSEHSFFLGTAVIYEQATEVVDVYELAKMVAPEWFNEEGEEAAEDANLPGLLLMEGSAFFRDLLRPTLESMDYQVWTVDNVIQARGILDQHVPAVIITDLDMKDQAGMDLARWVKKQERFEHIPLVALASFVPGRDEDEDLFIGSLMKSDGASLRSRLKEVLSGEVVL